MFRQLGFASLSLLPLALGQVSNDFESGWDQTAWPTYAPDCNQGGSVSLDSTVAHSGKNSMKVVGAGGYCGHDFFGTTQVPKGDVYVRVWMQAQKALTDSHVTMIVMPDAGLGTAQHLRFGAMSQVLLYNRQSDDATLPELSPQGIATSTGLPAMTWQCLEYHLGSDGTIQTWLNGDDVPGLDVGPGISNANAGSWTRGAYKPAVSGVYFGWESYGGDANTFWYDDIAISGSRVGCGAAAGGSSGSPTSKATSTAKPTSTMPVKSSTTAAPPSTTLVTSTKATTSAAGPSACTAAKWGQCGGQGWAGCTTCVSGTTCKASGQYYSQCL